MQNFTYELSLCIYLRYDFQNKMFIISSFSVGDFIQMCGTYFFISLAIGQAVLSQFLEIKA